MCGHKDRRLDGSPAAIGRTCAYLLDAQRLLDDAPTALEFFHAMLEIYPELLSPGRAVERHHHAVAQLTSRSCDVTAGAAMTPVPPHDPAAALNEVLSEVVDLVLALTAGASRGREGQELDTELHRLFTSGRTRSELLVDVDTSIRSRDAQDPVPILVTGRTGVITPVPRHRSQTNYEAVT